MIPAGIGNRPYPKPRHLSRPQTAKATAIIATTHSDAGRYHDTGWFPRPQSSRSPVGVLGCAGWGLSSMPGCGVSTIAVGQAGEVGRACVAGEGAACGGGVRPMSRQGGRAMAFPFCSSRWPPASRQWRRGPETDLPRLSSEIVFLAFRGCARPVPGSRRRSHWRAGPWSRRRRRPQSCSRRWRFPAGQ